jgi:hypothetical protein
MTADAAVTGTMEDPPSIRFTVTTSETAGDAFNGRMVWSP